MVASEVQVADMNKRTFLQAALGGFFTLPVIGGHSMLRSPFPTGRRREVAGETQNWRTARVVLAETGQEIPHVIEADERTGRILRYSQAADGSIAVTHGVPDRIVEYGRIKIIR